MAKPPKPPRRPGVRKTPAAKKPPNLKAAPKPKAPTKRKASPPPQAWQLFYAAHPAPWIGVFKRVSPMRAGLSATVRAMLNTIVTGKTAYWSIYAGDELIVGFADKADFDAAKKAFRGAAGQSPIKGVQDTFGVIL